ncbi:hypothetical protein GGR53DRAFT_512934 [Hypoxylon sp. FL1150]|nr:hypothetical protein GGR53DRAFT_512934 [Hypoxylon sp. FL1150]
MRMASSRRLLPPFSCLCSVLTLPEKSRCEPLRMAGRATPRLLVCECECRFARGETFRINNVVYFLARQMVSKGVGRYTMRWKPLG